MNKIESTLKWKVWWRRYDNDGKLVGAAVSLRDYVHKSSAVRWAKNNLRPITSLNERVEWIVSQTNPWDKEEKE